MTRVGKLTGKPFSGVVGRKKIAKISRTNITQPTQVGGHLLRWLVCTGNTIIGRIMTGLYFIAIWPQMDIGSIEWPNGDSGIRSMSALQDLCFVEIQ